MPALLVIDEHGQVTPELLATISAAYPDAKLLVGDAGGAWVIEKTIAEAARDIVAAEAGLVDTVMDPDFSILDQGVRGAADFAFKPGLFDRDLDTEICEIVMNHCVEDVVELLPRLVREQPYHGQPRSIRETRRAQRKRGRR